MWIDFLKSNIRQKKVCVEGVHMKPALAGLSYQFHYMFCNTFTEHVNRVSYSSSSPSPPPSFHNPESMHRCK